jgi:hypothetical protein
MYGGLTGFGAYPSLGGLLIGGAPPRMGETGAPKKARRYSRKPSDPTRKAFVRRDAPSRMYVSELGDVQETRKEARKIATEQRKRLTKTPGYKLYVKQYQNFLKDIAKNRLQHLTMEETVAIEQAIEMGHGADIPYLIADRDQHLRMLKAKHFPMWAAKEYTFDLHKPKSQREFSMRPYQDVYRGIADSPDGSMYAEPSMALVSSSSEPMYSPRVPRGLGSFMPSGVPSGLGLPQRRGVVRGSRGQFISPSSEEFLQVVPYSEY